jgi:hypothetical protein
VKQNCGTTLWRCTEALHRGAAPLRHRCAVPRLGVAAQRHAAVPHRDAVAQCRLELQLEQGGKYVVFEGTSPREGGMGEVKGFPV